MHRGLFAGLLAFALLMTAGGAAVAREAPSEVQAAIPAPQPVGQATFTWLFWDLFDGALWSADGRFSWDEPFALTLTYRTDFSAEELTDQTIGELDRLTNWPDETLAALRGEVARCMADVGEGDRFTATGAAADRVVLYLNGQQRCALEKPGLRSNFFRIWLSEDSQFPERTRQLTGRRE